jgi:hypothetical protein
LLGHALLYERTHVDRVQFFLARDAFRDVAPLLDAACGSTLDTPLGSLLGDYMIALESRLPDVTETDLSGLNKALGAMVAVAAAPSAELLAAATSDARSACGKPSESICGPRPLGRRSCVASSESPDPISIGCSKIAGVWPGYIQRERLIETHAMLTDPATTRSVSAIAEDLSLLTLPASAALSNGSSAAAPATCGRRRVLGWRSRCRRESSPCRWEETLASSFADPSRARRLANDLRSADRADVRIAGGRV